MPSLITFGNSVQHYRMTPGLESSGDCGAVRQTIRTRLILTLTRRGTSPRVIAASLLPLSTAGSTQITTTYKTTFSGTWQKYLTTASTMMVMDSLMMFRAGIFITTTTGSSIMKVATIMPRTSPASSVRAATMPSGLAAFVGALQYYRSEDLARMVDRSRIS